MHLLKSDVSTSFVSSEGPPKGIRTPAPMDAATASTASTQDRFSVFARLWSCFATGLQSWKPVLTWVAKEEAAREIMSRPVTFHWRPQIVETQDERVASAGPPEISSP